MTTEEVKQIINKTAKDYEIDSYNYVVSDEIYENDKYYMFSFYQNVEEPMDGMLFLIDKSDSKVFQTSYVDISASELNSMKPVK